MLISTSTMTSTARSLRDEVLAPLFTTPRRTIMGGSAPARGRAVPAPGGYRLTGRWSQGSNVLIAGWFHVGCHLWDGDRPRVGRDGSPVYLQCMLPAADAEVIDTWTTTGMRGTGSHDYAVTELFIPEALVHGPVVDSHRPQPLYQFVGWTHIAHAALGLAIARVAIEEFIGLAGGKKATWMAGEGQSATRTTIQAKVAQAEALVGSGRAYVARGHRRHVGHRVPRRSSLARSARHLSARHCAGHVECHPGRRSHVRHRRRHGHHARSRLDRCLRDVHTAAAHVWVAPDTYELAGRLLLGLDPNSTTI